MGAKVFFAPAKVKRMHQAYSLPAKLDRILREQVDLRRIVGGKRTVIKVHLGEERIFTTVHPVLVRQVVSLVKEAGGQPIVVHSWGAVDAATRGYSAETLGCPVLPMNGTTEKYYYPHPLPTDYPYLKEVYVSGEIQDAEAMVVITHVKGHGNTGMGAALKNVGIGMLAGPSRSWIHQQVAQIPYWNAEACGSKQPCNTCLESCPVEAIHWGGSNKDELHIDFHKCTFCNKCVEVCPANALALNADELYGSFQRAMALAAREVLSTFEPGHVLYLNYLLNITPWCDCHGFSTPSITKDVGVLVSEDPVAIDQASFDLLKDAELFEDMIPEDFQTQFEGSIFQRFLGTAKDPEFQIREAAKLGLGSREYELVNVDDVLQPKEAELVAGH
ncbi:4Fe-4S ferredoxin [Alicyclobacillus cellulosilyticus]|uniref:4Fe-4S ferredoxin n=1 Tax=Alicyclobacillus cellulosilyticus TaxID=1003997 RepID=A0A917KF18_9BACL|nr:DUF362 domain-containing protein [Alicyclobacillus cellulosilyticus]GGJ09469.1 4Fe-4S ferredoxin [Alicyclobacillus cellulosilyticus]